MKKLILIVGIIVAASVTADAQSRSSAVKKRQKNQIARIENGVNSGELTKAERSKLAAQQVHIRQVTKRAKCDGKVTPAERALIRKKQKNASKNIYTKKHNNQDM